MAIEIGYLGVYLLLGTLVGFMAGLLGVGGGGILVPLLVSLFNYQGIGGDKVLPMALATALASMIITAAASTRAHAARGLVAWPIVRSMAPGIVLGAAFTSIIAGRLNSTYIAVFFVVFMAMVSVQMLVNWQPRASAKPAGAAGLFLVGGGIGAVSALAAVGGGFLAIAYMTYKKVEIKKAIGSSAAIGLAIAIAGTLGYMFSGWSVELKGSYTLGFVYLPAFFLIATSSLLAAPYGARWAQRLPGSHLRKIFALVSMALSVKMLLSIYSG
ncbi:MAG TPA: sulfite exporter TauE/SafE family protein [Cellvibrio sp.]|nr:sulfite exporter TauE/SafE family protein [Cellvibrio sp.]